MNLRQQIERLQAGWTFLLCVHLTKSEISKFEALPNVSSDLEAYMKKLSNTKRKLSSAQALIESTTVRS